MPPDPTPNSPRDQMVGAVGDLQRRIDQLERQLDKLSRKVDAQQDEIDPLKANSVFTLEKVLNLETFVAISLGTIKIKVGSASITLLQNGDITIDGKTINVKGSGDIKLKGSKILQN